MAISPRVDGHNPFDEAGIARALRAALVAMSVSALAISAFTLFLGWRMAPQLALVAGVSGLVALIQSRSGQIKVAILVPLLTITYVVLHLAARSDGIQNIGLTVLPVLILVASLVLPLYMLLSFTAAVLLGVVAMLAIRYFVLHAERYSTNDMGDLFVFTLTCVTAAIVGRRIAVWIEDGFRRTEDLIGDLRASEEKFASAFYSAPLLLLITAMEDGQVLDVNAAFLERTGYSADELIGKTTVELGFQTAEERKQLVERLAAAPVTGVEVSLRTKAGERIACLFSGSTIAIHGKKRIVSMLADIQDRKRAQEARARLEQQLHQGQKMETLGRFAAGIAHDFNNLLTVINGYSSLLYDQSAGQTDLQRMAREVRNAGTSASQLTEQLLAFSRRRILPAEIVNLSEAVRSSESMLSRLIGAEIAPADGSGSIFAFRHDYAG